MWFLRAAQRLQPQHGWLPFALLAAALTTLVLSVLDVSWVPRDGVVAWTVALGFLAGAVLAQQPVRAGWAWVALVAGGLALALALTAELLPPLAVWREGAGEAAGHVARQWAFFVDRAAGWWRAVRDGGRSTETVVFGLGLALAGWLVAAFLAWSSYRLARPYLGLTAVGVAICLNTFYGQPALYWAVLFFGLAVAVATYLGYLLREAAWERAGVDYSAEVRPELLMYAAGISLGVMSLAMALPAINFRALAEAFRRQEAVVVAEQTLARAFAGVQQPRTDEGVLGAGGLPRSFLIGGDPALTETVVMTATVSGPGATLPGFHWRSVSYDLYTGDGWQRSAEREEPIEAGELIDPAAGPTGLPVETRVRWLYDRRATRYTLGQPAVFSHDIYALWRGLDDFVGARGRNNAPHDYTATSYLMPSDAGLAAATLDEVPPEIRVRYTALPRGIPDRVYDLARQAAGLADGAEPAPYEQARAIESFLHQYPYTLDLPAPPRDVDVVDYFLFDLQRGFCDYFASAMVVMARAVGLPARLGVGFLPQPAEANGVQTVRQINAHSWAEIYFAGYGWVEFEPTPPFAAAAPSETTAAPGDAPTFEPPSVAPIAVPERAPRREFPWAAALLGAAALALVGWRLWGARVRDKWRAPVTPLDPVQAAFAEVLAAAGRAGYPARPGQTPSEFGEALKTRLPEPVTARPAIERLTGLFAARQYGRAAPSPAEAQEAQSAARLVRRSLRRKDLNTD